MSDIKKAPIGNEVAVLEQNIEAVPETQKEFFAWIRAHKSKLVLVGISISTIIAVTLVLKNKSTIKALWQQLNKKIEKDNMYSSRWFETVTGETLSTEREKVRLAFCSSGYNSSEASRLQNLLWRFDNEIRKRAWSDEIHHAPSIRREHGWYLSNDD